MSTSKKQKTEENGKTAAAAEKPNKIVSHDEWIQARKELLVKEKELTKAKAALAQQRQALPWEPVKADYEFTNAKGQTVKLSQLFVDDNAPDKPLIVWHFMFSGGENGCHLCSFFLDGIQGIYEHLQPRAHFCAIAPGPAAELQKVQAHKGWTFPALSCQGTSFAEDLGTAFTKQAIQDGTAVYNYDKTWPHHVTAPGLSVFCKHNDQVYHTYSSYATGLADFNATFAFLDAIPEGRDEGDKGNMWWVKHKEAYENKDKPPNGGGGDQPNGKH